jgi:hypothetical protein
MGLAVIACADVATAKTKPAAAINLIILFLLSKADPFRTSASLASPTSLASLHYAASYQLSDGALQQPAWHSAASYQLPDDDASHAAQHYAAA